VKGLLTALAILLICTPMAVLTALLSIPILNWLERYFHIEWAGHSGPAEWLILAIYFVFVATAIIIWSKQKKTKNDG
jgi:NhaP-type Na+/H+ and K+/H+ antiporter